MYQVKTGMVQWEVKHGFSVEVEAEVTFEFIAPFIIKSLIQAKILRSWHIHYDSRNLVDLNAEERIKGMSLIRKESWEWQS